MRITQNAAIPVPYSSGFSLALAFCLHAETPQDQQRVVPEPYWQDNQYGSGTSNPSASSSQTPATPYRRMATDRQSHTIEAQSRFTRILSAINASDLNCTGEFIWAAVVHAVSAADPSHETTGADRFGNANLTPSYAEI